MTSKSKFRAGLPLVGALAFFACDVTDSDKATGRAPSTTAIAPRVVMAAGGAPKSTAYVRVSVKEIASGAIHDSVYPYYKRQGRVEGIPVGASIQISVIGFDSVVSAAGVAEVVNRWAGVNVATAKAVVPGMDSATVAATQPVVVAKEAVAVPVALPSESTLPAQGGKVSIPTKQSLGLTSAQEYRYALDVGDESKIVSVTAGSPLVPADGKIDVTATSYVKVRVFTRDEATGLMLGTDGDSTLVHVPPEVPSPPTLVAGDKSATIRWTPIAEGRIQVIYRQKPDTVWRSMEAPGALGLMTLVGLTNGAELNVRLRTVWGPVGGRDTSDATAIASVVPVGTSTPTALGAGIWNGLIAKPGSIGAWERSILNLGVDGKYEWDFWVVTADWSRSSWTPSAGVKPSAHYRIKGSWSMVGADGIRMEETARQRVSDSGIFDYDTARTWVLSIQAVGNGRFALLSDSSTNAWDTLSIPLPSDPVWTLAPDAVAPSILLEGESESVRIDTLWDRSLGDLVQVSLADGGSGIESVSGLNDGELVRHDRIESIDGTIDPSKAVGSPIPSIKIEVTDGAGNVARRTIYFASRPKAPDWTRTGPLADTTWVKSSATVIPFSGKASTKFVSLYLDSTHKTIAKDALGNVATTILPSLNVRRILYGVDDSGKVTRLDTFFVRKDSIGPVVTWTTPPGGTDTTLAAGTLSSPVVVTVSDAGIGVSTVKIGTISLVKTAGTSNWSGTVPGLVTGTNSFLLIATDSLGNFTSGGLTLKVRSAAVPTVALRNATSGDTLLLADTATLAPLQLVVRDKGARVIATLVADSVPRSTADSIYRFSVAAPPQGASKPVVVRVSFANDTVVLNKSFYVRRASPATSGTFTDARDGHVYAWVRIGTQKWMSENLVYGTQVGDSSTLGRLPFPLAGRVDRYCYANQDSNCVKFGGLYTWVEAMQLQEACASSTCATSVTAKHQGACPTDWHVPSDAEFSVLAASAAAEAGDTSVAGTALKATRSWTGTANGLDPLGFSALATGHRTATGAFLDVGLYARYWFSLESSPTTAWIRDINPQNQSFRRISTSSKALAFSVRCLAD